MNLVILPDRKCGTPKKGLYMTGTLSPTGTLHPFTALAAPFEALIAHARSYQKVDMWATLGQCNGLAFDGADLPFARLPRHGIADLWGKAAGYEHVMDVILETMEKGISRRIAKVPDLETPFPVLMMHVDAVVNAPIPEMAWDWLEDMGIYNLDRDTVSTRPWHTAPSLGRTMDRTYLDHPYINVWEAIQKMDREDKLDWWIEDNQIELRQGVFGLGWITEVVYVLGKDEDEVPEKYVEKGVVAAVNEHDPRGQQ